MIKIDKTFHLTLLTLYSRIIIELKHFEIEYEDIFDILFESDDVDEFVLYDFRINRK